MFRQAEKLLTQSLEIDSDFAPAWTELGLVYWSQGNFIGPLSIDEGNELARNAYKRAIAADAQYGPAYAGLARLEMFSDWDFTAAEQNILQALALDSGDAFILGNAGRLNHILGRVDEAIDLYRQSIARDPVSADGHFFLGRTLYAAHRLEEAAVSLNMARSLGPVGAEGALYFLGKVLLAQGDAPGALATMQQELFPAYHLTGLAIVQHALGNHEASDAALHRLMEELPILAGYQIAEIFAFRGDINSAFEWLDSSYDNRDAGMSLMLADPLLVNLHDDPRWEPLLDKMGFPQ
jgi:tetratricopeptide (TPR) repeat protein